MRSNFGKQEVANLGSTARDDEPRAAMDGKKDARRTQGLPSGARNQATKRRKNEKRRTQGEGVAS